MLRFPTQKLRLKVRWCAKCFVFAIETALRGCEGRRCETAVAAMLAYARLCWSPLVGSVLHWEVQTQVVERIIDSRCWRLNNSSLFQMHPAPFFFHHQGMHLVQGCFQPRHSPNLPITSLLISGAPMRICHPLEGTPFIHKRRTDSKNSGKMATPCRINTRVWSGTLCRNCTEEISCTYSLITLEEIHLPLRRVNSPSSEHIKSQLAPARKLPKSNPRGTPSSCKPYAFQELL